MFNPLLSNLLYCLIRSKHNKCQILNAKHGVHCITMLCLRWRPSYKIFLYKHQFLTHARAWSNLSNPDAQVPQCFRWTNAWVSKWLSTLSAQVPEYLKCPNAQVPFKYPSVQVPSDCLSPWVPSESPPSAQGNFRLAMTLPLSEKRSSDMLFKQMIIRFSLIQWFVLFCSSATSFGVEENI